MIIIGTHFKYLIKDDIMQGRIMKKRYLVIGIILSFIFISITPSSAVDNVKKSSMPVSNGNILYVGGIGPDNYTRIQDAIDNASDGDIVFVYDDSSPYNENFSVDKSIKLQGENMNTTISRGRCSISSNFVIISGFMFQFWEIPGMNIEGFSNNIIENCIFYESAAGIELSESNNNIIRNCNFIKCACFSLRMFFSNKNEISYCNFFNDTGDYGLDAIMIRLSRGISIHHCNITGNVKNGVSVVWSDVQLTSNNIFNNGGGFLSVTAFSSCDLRRNWWGSPKGPSIEIWTGVFIKILHKQSIMVRNVNNSDAVIFGFPRALIGITRIFPWSAEPVADAGQQT